MKGVTVPDNKVELISPPIMTMAGGEINGLPDRAVGKSPTIAVSVVRMIGKNRIPIYSHIT